MELKHGNGISRVPRTVAVSEEGPTPRDNLKSSPIPARSLGLNICYTLCFIASTSTTPQSPAEQSHIPLKWPPISGTSHPGAWLSRKVRAKGYCNLPSPAVTRPQTYLNSALNHLNIVQRTDMMCLQPRLRRKSRAPPPISAPTSKYVITRLRPLLRSLYQPLSSCATLKISSHHST